MPLRFAPAVAPPLARRWPRPPGSRTATVAALVAFVLAALGSAQQVPPAAQVSQPPARAVAIEQALAGVIARIMPAYVRIGGGSGVIVSADGYVLTNYHVVGDQTYKVRHLSGQTFDAINVGQDKRGDICLLKLQTDRALPYVPLGDSDAVRVGDLVIAMGNPWLYAEDDTKPTVTTGIVSATHRFQQGYADCIQVDARINPGNSGGPLISASGELLGINGRIAVRAGFGNRTNTGIGFAVPINQIRRFIGIWRQQGGNLYHAAIGGLALGTQPTEGRGARVVGVAGGSDAERAGFKPHDLIVAFDGTAITSRSRFYGVLGTYPEGWRVTITVERGDERLPLPLALPGTVTDSQAVEIPVPRTAPPPLRGPAGQPRTARPRGYLGVTVDLKRDPLLDGAPVFRVKVGTPAERAGLRVRDVLVAIDSRRIRTFADLKDALAQHVAGDTIAVEFVRAGSTHTQLIRLTAKP